MLIHGWPWHCCLSEGYIQGHRKHYPCASGKILARLILASSLLSGCVLHVLYD